jgi:hypothetical protein
MIININPIKNPVYGKDYDTYDFGFIHRSGIGETGFNKLMTTGINIFGSDPSSMFRPNHMFLVLDKNTTLEADGHDQGAVRMRDIKEYFTSSDYIHFKPLKPSIKQKINLDSDNLLLGTKFNEWPIFYIGIEKLIGLEYKNRKKPVPKFLNGSGIMCSNYFAKIFENDNNLSNLTPLKDKHWSKVTPYDFYASPDLYK